MRKIGYDLQGEVGKAGPGGAASVALLYDCLFAPSQVLRLMVGVQVTDEQLESITDRTVQEADEDGDGAVSFLEFTKVRRS